MCCIYSLEGDNRDAKMLHGWITSELQSIVTENRTTFAESPVSPEQLASLIQAIQEGSVSRLVAKEVRVSDTNIRHTLNMIFFGTQVLKKMGAGDGRLAPMVCYMLIQEKLVVRCTSLLSVYQLLSAYF